MKPLDKQRLTYKLQLIFLPLIGFELLFWGLAFWVVENFGGFTSFSGSESLVFKTPNYGYFFFGLPIFYAFVWFILRRSNKIRTRMGIRNNGQFPPISITYTLLKLFLLRSALVFGVIAAMQPSFGTQKAKLRVNDSEIVFAVDISNSMNTEDMSGGESRLTAAKNAITQYINMSGSNKVGMVIFAGSAYPQLPLTADIGAAKMYTEELYSDLISNQGTNIGLALDLSKDFFSEKKETKKIIVLITDGEDHEGGIDNTLKELDRRGIELQILGLGSSSGGLIPIPGTRTRQYFKDQYGKSVVSKLDKNMIQDLSDRADGKFVLSDDEFPNIHSLLADFNTNEPTNTVELELEIKKNHYQFFMFVAVVMILLFLGIQELEKQQLKRG
ncbi:VWA domain-containing protein [Lishizhenia sp.]|uniref:VWA domain-containing protein n=1 Tax=Lishizhenia sp. TaxID=2497594 RepID=UPI00299EDE5C|nr:VWA domain-containing protein [Lishizhenia sp.]